MRKKVPLVLLILDGWGYKEGIPYNAIASAEIPQWKSWWQNRPHCLLEASGPHVGLPEGQMGNSEVGHMHIGAGRVIEQDFTRISKAILEGEWAKNAPLQSTIRSLEKTQKNIHLLGLLSQGGVHAHEDHLFALLQNISSAKIKNIYLHLFLDGRDVPPQSALQSIARLEQVIKAHPSIHIASLSGRYYAMDRNNQWDRIEKVYNLLTDPSAEPNFASAPLAIAQYYQHNIFDEFIPPTTIGPLSPIADGDALLFFNFRSDRARQLTESFINPLFSQFTRKKTPALSAFLSMTDYGKHLPTTVLFPPHHPQNTLGAIVANAKLTQLRLAETEKYAHVTFFLNGGQEAPFYQESRQLIASPAVATYDLKPEMSAFELTDALIAAIQKGSTDLIIANYANADMVGHSGNFLATIAAIEALDRCFTRIGQVLEPLGGTLLITADHGNAEILFDEKTMQPHTAHTCQPVPFLYIGPKNWTFNRAHGSLIDIAPTVLTLLNLPIPKEMTGEILLEKKHD